MTEKWILQTKKAEFDEISKKFNINPVVARVIRNRDVVGDEEIEQYLNTNIESLSSPWKFKDMDKAVDILKIKIAGKNKIRIISDYDVDGICSGYILNKALTNLEADVDVVVPHRVNDGYGINESLIKDAKDAGVDTIVTCDNGIAASEQVDYAKELGMTVIITDHHEVPYTEVDGKKDFVVPNADAVVNHKQEDCEYPFKDLCGAMVAYQLMSALYESMDENPKNLQSLLVYGAMATVCDVVPLRGENRTIVKTGLELIKTTKDIGLNALIDACGISKGSIGSYHFGFILGPCLNASGRLDTAKRAVDLLNETNRENAMASAKQLKKLNDDRKDITEKGAKEAIDLARDMDGRILVIYLPDCHESVAGIIAGRVKEHYNKPTIVLVDSEDCIKGSGRSIDEYDMYENLSKVKDLFLKFGGHKMAAGLSIEKENVDELRKRLNEDCELTEEDLMKKIWVDCELPFKFATFGLFNDLKKLEPFGVGNKKPIFAGKNIKVNRIKILGKEGKAIRLEMTDESGFKMQGIMFNKSKRFIGFLDKKFGQDEIDKAMKGAENDIKLMLLYYPNVNEFNGREYLQLIIESFC
ncbi:MAG: single-stranded-DNA-specific exonuclease RecJ [Eubacterium sp.]|nr:single-stranded-DNA-specific exonuclease RecJ [Eubacterium sp.]